MKKSAMKPITITLDRLTLRDIDELTKVKYFSTSNICDTSDITVF